MFQVISNAKKNFGSRCRKFAGTITVEIIKGALEKHGILASPRDVFIKGLPIEIDLLVPKRDIAPEHGILYDPQDVLAVLEIKNYGSFGESTINTIKKSFQRINQLNKEIYCAYVTLTERKDYKWAISRENIGFPSYTLFWHYGSGKNFKIEPSGDWEKLVDDINRIVRGIRSANVA